MSFVKGVYQTDVPAPLSTILEALLHRRVWTPAQALSHMGAELAAAPKPSRLYPMRMALRFVVNLGSFFALAACAVTFCGCVILALGWIAGLYIDPVWYHWTGTSLGMSAACASTIVWWAVGLMISAAMFTGFLYLAEINLRGPAEWVPYSFDDKKDDVWAKMPDEVKRGGEAIQLILPDAKLTVLVLKQDSFNLDPVLEVAYTNPVTGKPEWAYPFIWDKDGALLEPH